ncbi:TraB/GumN family protein [Mucilaginibacter sp. dw_454]|uniref:TraB/GumN family protein n=1 Tax=Mucilaginibacter sp. dw_454 TaxID=2720079 RepID=UPI001BD3C2C4|nr:TraB/GumN family protein [Mucilaginibacter sp. dw_454]
MKKIILAIAFLLPLTNTYAQKNSLLWQISGNGLKTPSYLFGTYHLVGKNLVDSLPEIRTRFNTCNAVVGEMIMDSTMAMKLVPYMMAPDSLTLDKIFTPAEYQQIDTAIKQIIHVGAEGLNHFKPAAVATMLSALSAPNTTGPANPGIDMYFQQEGKRRNEKIIGLETLQQQAEMLLNEPMAEQKKQLLSTVKKRDQLRSESLKMYELYRHQDLDALGKMLDNDEEMTPEQTEKLLKNRNLNWIAQLPAIMNAQPTFIAVGVGHLIGQYGLIKQLRLKGYTVTAVKI